MTQRIIDAHNHNNWLGLTTDKIIKNMDDLGIEKCVLLACELPDDEYYNIEDYQYTDPCFRDMPFASAITAKEKYPDRFVLGWAPNPRNRFSRARLKAAVDTYDVKVYGELKCRMRYDDPSAIATYQYCGKLKLPVLFHLECPKHITDLMSEDIKNWPIWYGGGIEVIENMCRLCQDTIFIGHGPGHWLEISGDADSANTNYPEGKVIPGGRLVELMRKYKNLYSDISAGSGLNSLRRDQDHARRFLTEFQDRIVFGRDCFNSSHQDFLNGLELPQNILNKIFYENITSLIGR